MPYPKMSVNLIGQLRAIYMQTSSIMKVRQITGYNFRTIQKYCRDLFRPKPDKNRIIDVYAVTGQLHRTASVCKCSKTHVWRVLKAAGISVGSGASTWRRLYNTLRARVSGSAWRREILIRDSSQCVKCKLPSKTVHHTYRLADIRDDVLRQHPELNPFRSYQELRTFTNLVMQAHDQVDGYVLCKRCHDLEHNT